MFFTCCKCDLGLSTKTKVQLKNSFTLLSDSHTSAGAEEFKTGLFTWELACQTRRAHRLSCKLSYIVSERGHAGQAATRMTFPRR